MLRKLVQIAAVDITTRKRRIKSVAGQSTNRIGLRMKSPCHILIACTCFSDLLHELGQYPFVYHYFRNSELKL
ncbi:hypothetical protein ANCDUO_23523 [Ancylostoma duodenale]|uniref:Uncharacterized protein n=1 Tax=Ancylostoma duodenale TaxID=51022 RepID=A0A0C2FNL9_9BILA|nr:hypothetical protein ANCDUO_23523 [Ancylostoma duodenale]